jgi:hypothetical protein
MGIGSRVLLVLSSLAALLILLAALPRALLHLNDLTGIQHIAGIWMSLAWYSNAGVLYPPLEADGVYAGTRYMPVCFWLLAGLVKITGDYLVAAKLMALGSMVVLLAGVFLAVRRITGRFLPAVILTGLVLAAPEGMTALLSPHADALAVALTLLGLLLVERTSEESWGVGRGTWGVDWRSWLAAFLFTAAVMTKFSALAGPAAGAVVLVRTDRRRALWLLLPWLALTAAGLLLLDWFSAGRFLDNFRSLGSGGMNTESIRIGPARVAFAFRQTLPFSLLVALALGVLVWRVRSFGLGLWDWYLLATAGTTLLIFTSPGTGFNHLLELEVAAVLVVAQLFALPRDAPPEVASTPVPVWLLPSAQLLILGVLLTAGFSLIRSWPTAEDPATLPGHALATELGPDARVLPEDATVPVLLGQRPVVMDAFAYRVLAERGRIDDRELAGRIERQEFDYLVMMVRVDEPRSLCPQFHFGPRVTAAMLQAYRFQRQLGPYFLFARKKTEEPHAKAQSRQEER